LGGASAAPATQLVVTNASLTNVTSDTTTIGKSGVGGHTGAINVTASLTRTEGLTLANHGGSINVGAVGATTLTAKTLRIENTNGNIINTNAGTIAATSGGVSLEATSGIGTGASGGTAAPIIISQNSVGGISANNKNSGQIFLRTGGAVGSGGVTLGGAGAQIIAGGTTSVIRVDANLAAAAADNSIAIDAAIATGAGAGTSITLNSSTGSITSNDDANVLTANTVVLNAATGIGSPTKNIQTAATNVGFSNSTSGNVHINNSASYNVIASSNLNGNATLTNSAGNIDFTGNVTTGTGLLVQSKGTIGVSAGQIVKVNNGVLTLETAASNFINLNGRLENNGTNNAINLITDGLQVGSGGRVYAGQGDSPSDEQS
jgi:hypothetical protein